MHQAFQLTPGTRDVRAVDRGFILFAGHRRSAHGTLLRHAPRLLAAGAPFWNWPDDLRNHIARPFHLHPVALTKILGDDEVFVVERRQFHYHAADLHRLELRVRIQRPGSTDIDPDLQQPGLRDVGGELARDRPARLAPADDAQLLLKAQRIDFDDAAIDTEVQLAPDSVLQVVRPLLDFG